MDHIGVKFLKRLKFGTILSIGFFVGFTLVSVVFAEDSLPPVEKLGLPFESFSTPTGSVSSIIREIIKYIGILAVLALIYGGFLFMTAFGEDDKVKKAKAVVTYSIIGVVLSITAYSIVDIVNSLRL